MNQPGKQMIKVFTFLLPLLLLVGTLTAQPDSSFRQGGRTTQLEEIPVRAVRTDENFETTSSLFDRKEIEKQYVGQELPVVLARMPSVNWYSDGGNYTGYSYMRLRGIDQTRINFSLNGIPLNEPEDQGVYFSNFPDFLNSVRTLQVQRGVGVSSNGSSAFAGAVSMESPSLTDSSYTELSAGYGSFSTYRASAEFNTGLLKNKWALYTRLSKTGSDGFRENSGTNGSSFFLSAGYFARKGILKFTGFSGRSKNQMAYLASADSVLNKNYRDNPLSTEEKDEFRQNLAMLQYLLPAGRYSSFGFSAYYNQLAGGYSVLFSPDLQKFSVSSNWYGGMMNYIYQKKCLTIQGGIHANDYSRTHFSTIEPAENMLLYKNRGHKNEVSLYSRISYSVNRFTIYADGQYRYIYFNYEADDHAPGFDQDINWKFFNPKAGLSFALNQGLKLYASIGKTHREPTRNDLFGGYDNIDSTNQAEIGSFNRILPEQVADIELGTKLNYKKLRAQFNFYEMQFKNEIAAIGQLSYIGLPLRKNVNSSYRRGLELDLTYAPVRELSFTTQANVSKNRISTDTTDFDSSSYYNFQPLLTPAIIINQSVGYQSCSWLSLGFGCRYVSQSFLANNNDNRFVTQAFFVLNGSVQVRFLKYCSLEFMVNNISDRKCFTSGYVQGAEAYYFPMATRNYAVNFKFLVQ